MLRYSGWMAALIAVGFGLSGCRDSGPKLWRVSGKVTFQGKPVSAGIIRFSNPQAVIDMTAALHPDGAYEVVMARGHGLPEGTYQVAIVPPQPDPPLSVLKHPPPPKGLDDIPARYRQPSTSGLTLTVKTGDNTADFELKDH